MPDEFVNPYQFVPLKAPTPSDCKPVERVGTHDRYVAAARSGTITCTLTTESPLVIGSKREQKNGEPESTVEPYLGIDGQPAIPASSLRGLVSSIYEAASNSALRVLANTLLSVRVPAPVKNQSEEIARPLPKLGMLCQRADGSHYVYDLKLPPPARFREKYNVRGYSANRGTLSPKPYTYLSNDAVVSNSADNAKFYYVGADRSRSDANPVGNEIPNGIPGYLRVLGIRGHESEMPPNRLSELFIPQPEHEENFDLPDAVLKTFETLADQRTADDPRFPFQVQGARRNSDESDLPGPECLRLRPGDLVFFREDKGVVSELAVSQIWRKKVGQTHDFFRTISGDFLPFNKDRSQLTLAEQVFGFVEVNSDGGDLGRQAKALASRLKFGEAKLATTEKPFFAYDGANPKSFLLKELSNPKLPCPSMYFTGINGNAFIEKTTLTPGKHIPRGRKFYVHPLPGPTQPGWVTQDTDEEAKKRKAKVTPLKPGLKFGFTIRFDNLTDRELGFLLYALKPNDKFRHKLGMGKPLGLGSVCIGIDELELVDREKRYAVDDPFDPPKNAVHGGTSQFVTDLRKAVGECQVLEQIGDPSNTTAPVHYPQVAGIPTTGEKFEKEIYKWFVSNDKNHKKPLPIPTGKGEIPKLPRLS